MDSQSDSPSAKIIESPVANLNPNDKHATPTPISELLQPATVVCDKCNKALGVTAARVISNGFRLWHPECLACYNCRLPLRTGWFHERCKAIFCFACYNTMFRQRCAECYRPMKNDGTQIKAMDVRYHQKCFRCHLCRVTLNRRYSVYNKLPTCFNCYKCQPQFEPNPVGDNVLMHRLSSHDSNVITARHANDELDGEYLF